MASTVVLAAQTAAGQSSDITVTTASWATISAFVDDAAAATFAGTVDFECRLVQKVVTPGAGPAYQPVSFAGAQNESLGVLSKQQRQVFLDTPGIFAVVKGPTNQKVGVQLDQ